MYQARLFENEKSRPGKRCYGCGIHYHYISDPASAEAHKGSKMVHSAVTEMLANVRLLSDTFSMQHDDVERFAQGLVSL